MIGDYKIRLKKINFYYNLLNTSIQKWAAVDPALLIELLVSTDMTPSKTTLSKKLNTTSSKTISKKFTKIPVKISEILSKKNFYKSMKTKKTPEELYKTSRLIFKKKIQAQSPKLKRSIKNPLMNYLDWMRREPNSTTRDTSWMTGTRKKRRRF